MTLPLLLSKRRAAAHVGVSRASFDEMVRRGELPDPVAVLGGRMKRWSRAELDASHERIGRERLARTPEEAAVEAVDHAFARPAS